jgi:hypothetical protein
MTMNTPSPHALPLPLAPATASLSDTAVLHGLFLSYTPAPSDDFTLRLEIVSIPHSLPALETLVGGPVGALQVAFSGIVALSRAPQGTETSIDTVGPGPHSLERITSLFPSSPPLEQLDSRSCSSTTLWGWVPTAPLPSTT